VEVESGAAWVAEVNARSGDTETRGTGFYVGENHVLTSAHVVGRSDAAILVRPVSQRDWRWARAVFIAEDTDIALLEAPGSKQEADAVKSSPHEILVALTDALVHRAERTFDRNDINAAISLTADLLKTAPSISERWRTVASLSALHWIRARLEGSSADADRAESLLREALGEVPATHPDRPAMLSNLAATLRAGYDRTGDYAALDEATYLLREALGEVPATHPDRPAMLSNLAATLRAGYDRTGDYAALDEATYLLREALREVPATHPDRPAMLSNLAATLRAGYDRTGDYDVLAAELRTLIEAAASTPSANKSAVASLKKRIAEAKSKVGERRELDHG
jgi:Trypsin-like peptidase domain